MNRISLILPTLHIEKKFKSVLGKDLTETNISFPTQFNLQVWSNSVILKISVLGLGLSIHWEL